MPSDTTLMIAEVAIANMFKESNHFSICTVDNICAALGRKPNDYVYKQLKMLHCVDYNQMPPQLVAQLPNMVMRCIGAGVEMPILGMQPAVDTVPDDTDASSGIGFFGLAQGRQAEGSRVMETRINKVPEMTLTQFADREKLVMEVNERSDDTVARGVERFYASFQSVHVADDGMLIGVTGNADTPEEAIADYMKRISGKRIKYGYSGDGARYINVPRLTGVE